MKGQWLGKYQGDVTGSIMINIDDMNDHYAAVAYIIPDNKDLPSTVAHLATENKDTEQKIVAFLNPVDPNSGYQCKWDEIKSLYPEGTLHSDKANVDLSLKNNILQLDAISDINIKLSSKLEKPIKNSKSKIQSEKLTWEQYKSYVSNLTNSNYLYRGQEKPWELITSFHRNERYRINHFIDKDIKKLHQYLSAKTTHFFDLTIPEQNGAFYNLIQHHGYPTPLLDWSYSPYVAAFFAFRNIKKQYNGNENIRIYLFNNELWKIKYPQIQNVDPPFPHLSVMDFLAIDNDRLIPQQSVSTVTNIVDIEGYIIQKELDSNEKYLLAIDIPASERDTAMRELKFMGITAGSMFPTIDGVCEELRELYFDS